ncbi:MAG: hypothetical protein ACRDTS_07795, partial [Mycobacterium sp.]
MSAHSFLAAGAGSGDSERVWMIVFLVVIIVGAFGYALRLRQGIKARKQRRLPLEVQTQRIAGRFDGSETVIIPNNTTSL